MTRSAEAVGEYGDGGNGVEGMKDELGAWIGGMHAAELGVFGGNVIAHDLEAFTLGNCLGNRFLAISSLDMVLSG